MNQIEQVFERIKVVLGVSGGVISIQQVQDIAGLNHLDAAQYAALTTMLSENGIHPIPDQALPQTAPVPETPPVPPQRKEPTPEERAVRFDQTLLSCLKDMAEVPARAEQYREEMPLLKQAIAQADETSKLRKPDRIISRAVMSISRHRVRDIRHKGWVCGTHSNHVRDLLRRRLHAMFSPEELTELIQYCAKANPEKNPHFDEALLVLLHLTPRTIVHPHLSADSMD